MSIHEHHPLAHQEFTGIKVFCFTQPELTFLDSKLSWSSPVHEHLSHLNIDISFQFIIVLEVRPSVVVLNHDKWFETSFIEFDDTEIFWLHQLRIRNGVVTFSLLEFYKEVTSINVDEDLNKDGESATKSSLVDETCFVEVEANGMAEPIVSF
jgi:hypothetical protein